MIRLNVMKKLIAIIGIHVLISMQCAYAVPMANYDINRDVEVGTLSPQITMQNLGFQIAYQKTLFGVFPNKENFVAHCKQINEIIQSSSMNGAYAQARKLFEIHQEFFSGYQAMPVAVEDKNLIVEAREVLNVIGVLANRAELDDEVNIWCSLLVDVPQIRQLVFNSQNAAVKHFLLKNADNPIVAKLQEFYRINIRLGDFERLPEDKIATCLNKLTTLNSSVGVDIIEFSPSDDFKHRRKGTELTKAYFVEEVKKYLMPIVSEDDLTGLTFVLDEFANKSQEYRVVDFQIQTEQNVTGKLVLQKDKGNLYYGIALVRNGFERDFDVRIKETLPYGMKYIPLYTNQALAEYRNKSKSSTENSQALRKLLKIAERNRNKTTCTYNPVGSIEFMVETVENQKRCYVVHGSSGFQFRDSGGYFTEQESRQAIQDALLEKDGESAERLPRLVEEKFAQGVMLYKNELISRGFSEASLENLEVKTLPCSMLSKVIGSKYCRRHKGCGLSQDPYRARNMCPSKCAERGAKIIHQLARIISFDEQVLRVELLDAVDLNETGMLVRFRNIDTGLAKTSFIRNDRISQEEQKNINYDMIVDVSSSTPLCIHCADHFKKFNDQFVAGKNVYIYQFVRPLNYNTGAGDVEQQRAQDMAAMDMVMQSRKIVYLQLPEEEIEEPIPESLTGELLDNVILEIERNISIGENGTDRLPVGVTFPDKGQNLDKEAVIVIKPPVAGDQNAEEEILQRVQNHGYEVVGMRMFDGNYFESNPDKIATLYKEAYEGYVSERISVDVQQNIDRIYNNESFEFFFGVPFSPEMVIPGQALKAKYNLSDREINELWKVGRPDISFGKLKSQFSIDSVEVADTGILLQKSGKKLVLPLTVLGRDRQSIIWFRANMCFGINKVGSGRNVFPIHHPKVNNGRPVLVVNGYLPGLINLFKETPDTRTVAIVVRSVNSYSASWRSLREELTGDDNNPRGNTILGSIRRDAVCGEFPLPVEASEINGQKNVLHVSSGALEALSDMVGLFGMSVEHTSFGKLLIDNGYSLEFIKYLITAPSVRIMDDTQRTYSAHSIFELTRKLEPSVALAVIKKFFPPLNEDAPNTCASITFAEFLSLKRKYMSGELSVEKTVVDGSDLDRPNIAVRIFEEVMKTGGYEETQLEEQGMQMVKDSQIAHIAPAGGTSGRFYGYNVPIPEWQKIKVIQPIWSIDGKLVSCLEIKMGYLRYLTSRQGGRIPFVVMGSGININYLAQKVEAMHMYPESDLYFYAQGEIPRLNPTIRDLKDAGAFKDRRKFGLSEDVNEAQTITQWVQDNGVAGDIFRNNDGTYSGKPIGHFDIIAKLILSRRLLELAERGIEVLHIANGDDVGAILDPAKCAYLMNQRNTDILSVLVRKQTEYSINKKDPIFDTEVRDGDKAAFTGEAESFRVIVCEGEIIQYNLPRGVIPEIKGDEVSLYVNGKCLKENIKGKKEKGGTFAHVKSKGKDMILDQPIDAEEFSTNQFYIKVASLLKIFDLGLEEYKLLSQKELQKKVEAVTAQMNVRVEIKPINVGTVTDKSGEQKIAMRPAAQLMRYLGEITGLKGLNTEPILVDRYGNDGRGGYCSVKDLEGIPINLPVVQTVYNTDKNGNSMPGTKLIMDKVELRKDNVVTSQPHLRRTIELEFLIAQSI